jgi:hypothetical protein
VSVRDRSGPPHGVQDAIQEDPTRRGIDVEGIELVMIDGFSASS